MAAVCGPSAAVRATEPGQVREKDPVWFENSLIYNISVNVFQDSDGDGVGDFPGLISRLDYLQRISVDVIWLAPFQPSPGRDDGYDVSDYDRVDPKLGTDADFRRFVEEARRRRIRVITDLVINHTSDQHPWFQQARKDPQSPYRDWYVWAKKRPWYAGRGMVFPGYQKEIWSWDPVAHEYFYHRFYRFQPDLNMQNPAVQAEISKILRHWSETGIAGFRVDAVPFVIEVPKLEDDDFPRDVKLLEFLRHEVSQERAETVLLGEANVKPSENSTYFGDGNNRLNMMFNFFVNQHVFYALAAERTQPLREALELTHVVPPRARWAQFLRNHDEVDLGRLTPQQRQMVYEKFGPERRMQLYDRGIRRRLAPMMGDRKRVDLAYNVLFSLPSTPVLRYGEEIGMGDDLRLPERNSVRTPMQWSNAPNAGFSSAKRTVRPVIDWGEYGYRRVNVEAQLADSDSLLQFLMRLIQVRKESMEIGRGDYDVVPTGTDQVLALRYRWKDRTLLVLNNFSGSPQTVKLDVPTTQTWQPLLQAQSEPCLAKPGASLRLKGYGFEWYRQVEPSNAAAQACGMAP